MRKLKLFLILNIILMMLSACVVTKPERGGTDSLENLQKMGAEEVKGRT